MMFRWSSRDIFLIAAVLLAGAVAMAQQPGGSGTSPSSPSSPSTQQPTPPGATMPGNSGMPDTSSQSYGDQSFLRKTLEDDVAQEQMGQLAAQKSQSDDVKQFGQKMVQIHTELNDQLRPAAKQLGVDELKGPSKKQKQEIAKLEALSGPDFDTAYIQAMAKQQQHDLKGFKDEATAGQNPNVQMAAKQDAPILEQHYQVLEKLAQVHNVTLESKK
jgi:putative membrane protein